MLSSGSFKTQIHTERFCAMQTGPYARAFTGTLQFLQKPTSVSGNVPVNRETDRSDAVLRKDAGAGSVLALQPRTRPPLSIRIYTTCRASSAQHQVKVADAASVIRGNDCGSPRPGEFAFP